MIENTIITAKSDRTNTSFWKLNCKIVDYFLTLLISF